MFWILLAAAPLVLALVSLMMRPLYIHRGLSESEWRSRWFGDEFLPEAEPSGSRAIFIDASAESVWPWLTQIGQDRAGFYSYQWLENLAGAQMPDIRERRHEWSTRETGQKLRMAPKERYGPIAEMDIVAVEPNLGIVARNREGVWSFLLIPINSRRCRLVARGTWIPSRNWLARAMHSIVFDPIHYLMEWKMIRSIKALAESHSA